MIGNPKALSESKEALQKYELSFKIMKGQHDYLSCEAKFSTDEKGVLLRHLYLIKSMETIELLKHQVSQNI